MSRQPFGRPAASSPSMSNGVFVGSSHHNGRDAGSGVGRDAQHGRGGVTGRMTGQQQQQQQLSGVIGPGDSGPNSGHASAATGKRGNSPFLNLVGLAQPHLDIQLDENVLFLHPAPPDEPAQDPIVQGTVTLRLPKKRTLNHLTVRLVGRQDVSWIEGRPYESHTTLDKEVALFSSKQRDVELDKGEHKFTFSIIVPSSTACCEKCPYGRTRHSVVAKAKGLGQLGTDVLSQEKNVFLIANPGGAGASSPPPPLDYRFEGVLDDIGPYTMALQSQHVMVSGLLLFRFHLVSPPSHIVIYSIKVKINQYFELHSPTDITRVGNPPPDVRTVIIMDGNNEPNFGAYEESANSQERPQPSPRHSVLKLVAPGQEYKVHHLGRLPDDSVLRPSTQEWSETCIRVRHEVAMEVTYRVMTPEEAASGVLKAPEKVKGKEKEKERIPDRKKLVVSKPLEVFSCCCFVDSLTLPAYAVVDPLNEKNKTPLCLCGFDMGQVIKFHGQDLLREEGEPGLTYAPLIKTNSDLPTPTDSRGARRGFGGFFRTDSSERLSPLGSPMSPGARSPAGTRSPSALSPPSTNGSRSDYFSSTHH